MDKAKLITVTLRHAGGMKLVRTMPEHDLAEYLELATEIGWVIVRVTKQG